VKAAGKIAPLLSWRQLRELPWVFRICFLLIGTITFLLMLALIVSPLLLLFWLLLF
jgi:hypothetical protein